MNIADKYKFKGKLLTVEEIMNEDGINLSREAIYYRIKKNGIKPKESVTRLLQVQDLRVAKTIGGKDIHVQRNELKAIKESLNMTWDQLAREMDMNPRTFADYRLPETSKAYKVLKDNHRKSLDSIVKKHKK